MSVEQILEAIEELSDKEYQEVLLEAMKQNRAPELKKIIRKSLERNAKADMKKGGKAEVPKERDTSGCSLETPKPTSSRESSVSAFQSPFIFRGDLTPKTGGFVFFDVEKLSLQIQQPETKHKMVASSAGIVNDNKDVILWSFIKWKNVCQTFPQLTGITLKKLEIGLEISAVKPFLKMAFKNNHVVGWDMNNDLLALLLEDDVLKIDLANYFTDPQNQPYKLKDVWKHFFGETIQCGVHSAIQDARATRDLYYVMEDLKKKYPNSVTCPYEIQRSPKEKFVYDKNDVCKCKKNRFKKPKQGEFFLPEK